MNVSPLYTTNAFEQAMVSNLTPQFGRRLVHTWICELRANMVGMHKGTDWWPRDVEAFTMFVLDILTQVVPSYSLYSRVGINPAVE